MLTTVNERLAALRRGRNRRQVAAHLLFLISGLGFGSAVYLARTRFTMIFRSGRFGSFLLLVLAATAVFALAAWLHGQAARRAEEIAELEEEIKARR